MLKEPIVFDNIEGILLFKFNDDKAPTKEELTNVSACGYRCNKNNDSVCFDFLYMDGDYFDKDRIIKMRLYNLDHDYPLSFFKDSYISDDNDIHVNIEINNQEVESAEYGKPVYMELYNEMNDEENVVLMNKLSELENEKFINK